MSRRVLAQPVAFCRRFVYISPAVVYDDWGQMAITQVQIYDAKKADKPYTLSDGHGLSLVICAVRVKALAL